MSYPAHIKFEKILDGREVLIGNGVFDRIGIDLLLGLAQQIDLLEFCEKFFRAGEGGVVDPLYHERSWNIGV
jgi:hypothetical protein